MQKGCWRIKQSTALDYREPFWLVVRCLPNWQSEGDVQRYAVVITLLHFKEGVPLYTALRTRVQEIARARVR